MQATYYIHRLEPNGCDGHGVASWFDDKLVGHGMPVGGPLSTHRKTRAEQQRQEQEPQTADPSSTGQEALGSSAAGASLNMNATPRKPHSYATWQGVEIVSANDTAIAAPCPEAGTDRGREWPVVMMAFVVGLLIFASSLLGFDGDLTALLKFGSDDPTAALTAHAEAVLNRDVTSFGVQGHDGKYFFLQALDPLYLSPEEHAVHLDRPGYRAQRMLFPLVAGLGGLLPPETVLWSMPLVNIAAIALGTLGTARLAQRLGGSAWLGLAFTVNPGIVYSFIISGAGIVAFVCAVWGTLAVVDGCTRSAVVWFVATVLAREVTIL